MTIAVTEVGGSDWAAVVQTGSDPIEDARAVVASRIALGRSTSGLYAVMIDGAEVARVTSWRGNEIVKPAGWTYHGEQQAKLAELVERRKDPTLDWNERDDLDAQIKRQRELAERGE
jgi:hypothetical protein